jgi:hypothetical protein
MLDRFIQSVARIPGLVPQDLHEAQRSAKLLRRRIEAGHRPHERDWEELFPEPSVRRLAQIHLDEGPGTPEFDPEATLTPESSDPPDEREEPALKAEDWYVLLTDIPEDGLPCPLEPDERIESWELGRMVVGVSRGMETVDFQRLPIAEGFRERFLGLARATGRLECIRNLPRSA